MVPNDSSRICCCSTDSVWKDHCPSFLWIIYVSGYNFIKKMSLIDSPTAIIMIQAKEITEICLQS